MLNRSQCKPVSDLVPWEQELLLTKIVRLCQQRIEENPTSDNPGWPIAVWRHFIIETLRPYGVLPQQEEDA